MNQGEWALTMSALSLGVSSVLGVWQVWRYFLEGGRAMVTMEFGRLHADMFSKQSTASHGSNNPFFRHNGGDDYLEVLFVTVANRGRTALTVSEAGIDLGPTAAYRWRPRKRARNRHRVTPTNFAFEGERTRTPVRLEPFDSCLFIYDAEPALSTDLGNKQPVRVLRGYALVAGRHKAAISKESMSVSDGRVHLSEEKPSIRRVIYAALDRDRRADDSPAEKVGYSPEYLAWKVSRAMDEGTSLGQALKDAIDDEATGAMPMLTARMALRKHGYAVELDPKQSPLNCVSWRAAHRVGPAECAG